MHFTLFDFAFDAVGFVGHIFLLFVLLRRRIAGQFPLFTVFVIFQIVRTTILVPILIAGMKSTY